MCCKLRTAAKALQHTSFTFVLRPETVALMIYSFDWNSTKAKFVNEVQYVMPFSFSVKLLIVDFASDRKQ